jgi:hypothetical protein
VNTASPLRDICETRFGRCPARRKTKAEYNSTGFFSDLSPRCHDSDWGIGQYLVQRKDQTHGDLDFHAHPQCMRTF